MAAPLNKAACPVCGGVGFVADTPFLEPWPDDCSLPGGAFNDYQLDSLSDLRRIPCPECTGEAKEFE